MSRTTAQVDVRHQDAVRIQRQQAQRSRLVSRILLYTAVILLSIIFVLPFIWMISTSLKDDPQTFRVPPIWIPNPMRFANYPEALIQQPFGRYFHQHAVVLHPFDGRCRVLGGSRRLWILAHSLARP